VARAVKVYSLSTCSHCNAVKKLLTDCRVAYAFTDVDRLDTETRKTVLEEIRGFNPECSFPTVVIGRKVVVGYNEQQLLEALGVLEAPIVAFFKKILRAIGRPGSP